MSAQIDTPTYCAVHPDRETGLRCIRCDRYMCTECAVRSATGYICRECARQHDNAFFTASGLDNVAYFGVPLVIGAISMALIDALRIGFLWFLLIPIALGIAALTGEIVIRLTKKRRGRYRGELAALGAILGALAGSAVSGSIVVLGLVIFGGIFASTLYGRFKIAR